MEHIAISTEKTARFILADFERIEDIKEVMADMIFTFHENGINRVTVDFLSEEEYQESLKKTDEFIKRVQAQYNQNIEATQSE